MRISVTDDHFYQTWFVFSEGDFYEKLIRLQHDLFFNIYPYEYQENIIFPSVLDKDLIVLQDPYVYGQKPRIRFSTHGLDIAKGEIRNNNSLFIESSDGFFNAEIYLPEIDDLVVQLSGLTIEDIIIYAKYKWCIDMGITYLRQEEARQVEYNLENTQNEINEGIYTYEEDDYSKVLKQLKSMPYKEYLQTDHWKHFKNEALIFFNRTCKLCGRQEGLHVHHNTYKNRGRETFNDVVLLCSSCHKNYHNK